MYRIPVYEQEGRPDAQIVARVQYNQMLDNWNGSNWQRGGVGRHLGLTILRDGTPVLIYGTNWQGERDYGVAVTQREAIHAIMGTDDAGDILAQPRFRSLREWADSNLPQEA